MHKIWRAPSITNTNVGLYVFCGVNVIVSYNTLLSHKHRERTVLTLPLLDTGVIGHTSRNVSIAYNETTRGLSATAELLHILVQNTRGVQPAKCIIFMIQQYICIFSLFWRIKLLACLLVLGCVNLSSLVNEEALMPRHSLNFPNCAHRILFSILTLKSVLEVA